MVVVLPEPLGPMRPRTSPRATVSDSASTATRPPKRLVRSAVSSSDAPAALSASVMRASATAPRSDERLPEPLDLDDVPVGIADERVVDPVGRIVRGRLDELDALGLEARAPLVHVIRDQRDRETLRGRRGARTL